MKMTVAPDGQDMVTARVGTKLIWASTVRRAANFAKVLKNIMKFKISIALIKLSS